MENKTSIIFVPGIYHGPWCWKNFTKYFEDNGYYTEAVNLLGNSDNSRRVTLNDYFNIIEHSIEEAKKLYHGPIILIGHSKGGGIVQGFIAQRPGKADGAVLLAALPLRQTSNFVINFLWRMLSRPRTSWEMIQLLYVSNRITRLKPVSADILQHCALFSSRISITEAKRYASLFSPDPIGPALELAMLVFKNLQADIPVLVVASTGDRVFSPWEENLIANAYGGDILVLNDLCHDMMLDPEWKIAAEATAKLIKQIEDRL